MLNPLIKDILAHPPLSQEIKVRGWVRTKRELKNLVFVEINDGSAFTGIQCTFDRNAFSRGAETPPAGTGMPDDTAAALSRIGTGASVEIRGRLVPSPASGQAVEIAAETLLIIGEAPPETYPLQKKRHSLEFLREIAHLRARTNTFGAVARVRNRTAFAIHQYFQERGFLYIHTPIITSSDAEGAGAMFQVTTLDLEKIAAKTAAADKKGSGPLIDYGKDFFGKPAYLTVSGQLEAETYATALSRVYTFGPTFRAENSNTTRHLAEFWMVEPEMAFAQLEDNMDLAEDFLKNLFTAVLRDNREDLAFFENHIEKGVTETLQQVIDSPFTRMTYTEAVAELEKAARQGPGKSAADFEYKPFWGCDLQSEHEKFLTEQIVRGPVILTDYPREIKAFYMKMNDDEKTVRAMDVLVPRLGEIIGGSQREDRLEKLEKRIIDSGMKPEHYSWYLDLRRYGTVPHSGFGLGFERLIQYITGMANIRDVIPYPRTAGQAEF
jgi:asparaginyl-tRNA synthetase